MKEVDSVSRRQKLQPWYCIRLDLGCGSHRIPQPHLNQRPRSEDVSINGCVLFGREEAHMAQLCDLVPTGILYEPPRLGICCRDVGQR